MCAGDTSLERSREEDGKIVQDVDGWGVQHECRNYDTIYQFAKENRSDNRTGII
jgi:hypothetical protein